MIPILATNIVTQIEDKDTGQLLGYGFESDATTAEKGNGAEDRLQRWLLFCATGAEWFRHERLRLRPALDPNWSAIKTPTDFVTMARKTFTLDRDTYAVVNFKAVSQGKPIVPSAGLPRPRFYPTTPTNPFQMDFRVGRIWRENGGIATVVGFVNAKSLSGSTSMESWALLDTYAPPDTNAEFWVEPFTNVESEVFANLIDGTTFTSQSNFNLGACAYFNDQVPE